MDPIETIDGMSADDIAYLMHAISRTDDHDFIDSKGDVHSLMSLPSTDTGGMNSSIDDESMSSSTYGIKQDHRQINKIPTSVGTERKPRQKGESDAARDRRKERNRLLAQESRKKKNMESSNLVRETEILRFQNSMLLQSIKEVMGLVRKDSDHSNPTMQAIQEVMSKAELNISRDIPTFDGIGLGIHTSSSSSIGQNSSSTTVFSGVNVDEMKGSIPSALEGRTLAIQERIKQKRSSSYLSEDGSIWK